MYDEILDNFQTVIEAITPPTESDRRWRLYRGAFSEAPKTAAQERRFALETRPGVQLMDSGPMSSEIWLTKVVNVVTAYPLGRNLLDCEKQIQRDVDLLIYALIQPAHYCTSATCELASRLPTGELEMDVDDEATYAVVRLPFEVKYKLTFTPPAPPPPGPPPPPPPGP